MSTRRAARGTLSNRDALPPDLAGGPCIEDWSDDSDLPRWTSARRNWGTALREWCTLTGRGWTEGCDLARTAAPWSRNHLRATGRADWAAWLDGHAPKPQGTMGAPLGPPWFAATREDQ